MLVAEVVYPTGDDRAGAGGIVGRNKRSDYIYSRAYELAASGLHLEPITIISALIDEGYPEAAEILDSTLIRDDLRQLCVRNWPGVSVMVAVKEPEPEADPPSEDVKPPS